MIDRGDEIQWMVYNIRIAPALDPKGLPKSFEQFKEGKKIGQVDEATINFFASEMQKFNDLQKNGKPKITG